jgi:hypothetical protein
MNQNKIVLLINSLMDGFNRGLPEKGGRPGMWQPTSTGETFCNLFVDFVAQSVASYSGLHNKLANTIYDFVVNPDNGWVKVDGMVGQCHANSGAVVLAAQKNLGGHGHVCVLCPGTMEQSGTFGKLVPKFVNVGKDVFAGKKVSYAFQTEPDYFVLGSMVE